MDYVWLCFSAARGWAPVNAIAGADTLLTFSRSRKRPRRRIHARPGRPVRERHEHGRPLPRLLRQRLGLSPTAPRLQTLDRLALPRPAFSGARLGTSLVSDSFRFVVPWLILLAAVLFLLQPTIAARLLKHQATAHAREPSPRRARRPSLACNF